MSHPVGTPVSLSPQWLATAHARAAEFGFGQDLAGLGDHRWEVLCQAVELTVAETGPTPPDWRSALARQAGRTATSEHPVADEATLRQDRADVRLAEKGEVFAVDDDA
jgi:hypothetical protein